MSPFAPALVLLVLLAGVGCLLLRRRGARRRPVDALLDELERAMRRTGRRLEPGLTLAELERRFAGQEGAVRYLRALRDTRYAGRATPPSAADRRALRAALAHGLGPAGRLRAWYALPPRRSARRERHRDAPTLDG